MLFDMHVLNDENIVQFLVEISTMCGNKDNNNVHMECLSENLYFIHLQWSVAYINIPYTKNYMSMERSNG